MPATQAFALPTAGTVTITVSGTSSRVALPFPGNPNVLIYNGGTAIAYVAPGSSSVTATVPSGATGGSTPLPPGSQQVFSVAQGVTHIAAIDGGTGGTVYITQSVGL